MRDDNRVFILLMRIPKRDSSTSVLCFHAGVSKGDFASKSHLVLNITVIKLRDKGEQNQPDYVDSKKETKNSYQGHIAVE